MKASELRIGNFIQDKKDREVEILQVAHIGESLVNYWIESVYQPIPLTEEWLVKFGFEDYSQLNRMNRFGNDLEDHKVFYIGEDEEYQVHFITSTYGGVIHNETVFYKGGGYDDIAPIAYVHQLQNLYFALTGEELTLKES